MTQWVDFVPVVAVAVALLLVPGYVVLAAAGFRRPEALWLAGPVSLALVAVATVMGPRLGLDWGLQSLLPVVLVSAVAAFVLARFLGPLRRTPVFAERWLTPLVAVAAVAVGLAAVVILATVFGEPTNFADRFDTIFHLNATRYILDTANASPFHIGGVATPYTPAMYPSVWHASAALVAGVTGTSVVVATNALTCAVVVAIWVPGAMALGALMEPQRQRLGAVVGATLAVFVPGFYLTFLWWGSLYPNFLAFSCTPALVVLVLTWVRGYRPGVPRQSVSWLALVTLTVVAGAAASHTNFILVAALVVAVVLVAESLEAFLAGGWSWRSRRAAWTAGGLIGALGLWVVVRPTTGAGNWGPLVTLPQGLGEALTLGYFDQALPVGGAVVVLAGVWVSYRERRIFPLVLWVATSVLYVVAASFPQGLLRTAVIGGFYSDNPRLAALALIGALPVGIIGAVWLASAARRELPRRFVRVTASGASLIVLGAVVVMLAATASVGALSAAMGNAHKPFALVPYEWQLNPDELALIELVPELVPEDGLILVMPKLGGALTYALTGREVSAGHIHYTPTPQVAVLEQELRDAATDPVARRDVCEAIDEIGQPVYYLDFQYSGPEYEYRDWPGLQVGLLNLRSPVVEQLARVGQAKLSKVVICDTVAPS